MERGNWRWRGFGGEIWGWSVLGRENTHTISTSVGEGYTSKIRQRISCFGRKTTAFSKSIHNHIAKMNIFQLANNLIEEKIERKGVKKRKRRTPAMIEGIENHGWTWREFLECHAMRIK